MNYKLIAMDFDSTLLRDDKTISSKTKNILNLYKKLLFNSWGNCKNIRQFKGSSTSRYI